MWKSAHTYPQSCKICNENGDSQNLSSVRAGEHKPPPGLTPNHRRANMSGIDGTTDEPLVEILPAAPPTDNRALALAVPPRPDQHPAAVYLARLAPGSRRTIASSLDLIAGLLTSYRCD